MKTAEEFLEWVGKYPNGPINHTKECELRKIPSTEWNEDNTCTCGYWANAFADIKIGAMHVGK